MPKRCAIILIASSFLVILALAIVVGAWAHWREQALQARHESKLAVLKAAWAQEAIDRERDSQKEEAARRIQRNLQMEALVGGPLKAAALNPAYTIAEMLQATARACAPTGSIVSVDVDRFTEFEIKISMKEKLELRQLSEIAICAMRQGYPYVRSLLFIHANRVLASVDEHVIESQTNWAAVTPDQLAPLLAESETQTSLAQAGTSEASTRDSATVASLTPEEQSIQDATQQYNQLQQKAFDQLNQIIKAQDSQIKLNDIRLPLEMVSRQQALDADAETLRNTTEFLLDPVPKLRQLLEARNVDALHVKIYCRAASERFQRQTPYLKPFLDAIAERGRSARAYLDLMHNQWGAWKYHSDQSGSDTIEFQTAAARDLYHQAREGFDEKTRTLNSASESLSKWNLAQEHIR